MSKDSSAKYYQKKTKKKEKRSRLLQTRKRQTEFGCEWY